MIEGLSDQEKSVLLARAMGWTVNDNGLSFLIPYNQVREIGLDCELPGMIVIDIYHPRYHALAWRVHLFACNHRFGNNSHWPYLAWFEQEKIFEYEDGQSRWLDKILELAIEAGITEEQW